MIRYDDTQQQAPQRAEGHGDGPSGVGASVEYPETYQWWLHSLRQGQPVTLEQSERCAELERIIASQNDLIERQGVALQQRHERQAGLIARIEARLAVLDVMFQDDRTEAGSLKWVLEELKR